MLQFAENLTWQKGSHALKFGVEYRRDSLNYIDLRSLNGELNFPDGRYTGFGLGDFLLGLSSAQRLTLFHEPDLYANGWQFYAQDSWRVRPNLTISAGLRYEAFTPLHRSQQPADQHRSGDRPGVHRERRQRVRSRAGSSRSRRLRAARRCRRGA